MQTVVGIDVGTQSSKVMFYDFSNKAVVAVESAPHDIISKSDGTSEQDPAWWIQAVSTAMSRISEDIRKSAVAVSVSGQQHGFVAVDSQGTPLCPAKLWNDTSTVQQCDELTQAFGGVQRLIDELGNPLLPGYTAGKILWLKQNRPELFSKLHMVLLPHDYLNYKLTGDYSMEYGDASGTGLLNITTRQWNSELIALIDENLQDKLPPLRSHSEGAGWVSAAGAAEFGLPEGIPVACGGGDNMMAAIGTGAVSDGSLTMSLGTSGTLFGFSGKPVIDPEGIIAAFCSSTDGWLPLLCTMNCTVATENFRSLFDIPVSDLDELVATVNPGCDGLSVLPYFTGERIPNMPRAKASIQGMDQNNFSPAHILRASMEAAIYGMKIGLDRLEKLGMGAKSITITGGGSNSKLWRQIAADITGLPIVLPPHADSAAMGAALQALWFQCEVVGGNGATLAEVVDSHLSQDSASLIQPSENRSLYESAYARYLDYLQRLTPLYI